MAFCTKCGSHLENDVKFCPQCGAPVEGPAPSSTAEELERAFETQDTTGGYTAQDIAENKLMCILCYFGLLLLIPLLVKKDSSFVRFHCNQGLVLFLFNIIASIVSVIPFIGWLVGIVASIAGVIFWVLGVINAVNGRAKTLPLIGKITLLK